MNDKNIQIKVDNNRSDDELFMDLICKYYSEEDFSKKDGETNNNQSAATV